MKVNSLEMVNQIQSAGLDEGPVVVLNLLKFKAANSLTLYLEYMSRVSKECGLNEVEVVYAGELKECLQGSVGDWDYIVLARYPCRRVFYELMQSSQFQALNPLAEQALHDRVLWMSEPVLPFVTRQGEFNGGDWLKLLGGI